ncbi:hypothetical protein OG21DRAFT_1605459 [Imleria badia]|nr:hypothetical protein OG21DRAFT_1605459 [Imleria badia]
MPRTTGLPATSVHRTRGYPFVNAVFKFASGALTTCRFWPGSGGSSAGGPRCRADTRNERARIIEKNVEHRKGQRSAGITMTDDLYRPRSRYHGRNSPAASRGGEKALGRTFLGETRDEARLLVGDFRISGLDGDHMWGAMGSNLLIFMKSVGFRATTDMGPKGFVLFCIGKEIDEKKLSVDHEALFDWLHCVMERDDIVFEEVHWLRRPNIRIANTFGQGRVFITRARATKNEFPVIAQMLKFTTHLLDKNIEADLVTQANSRRRRDETYMLGINNRGSRILVDEFDEGENEPLQGRRIIGSNAAPTRLFNIYKPVYHTVLVFTDDKDYALPVVFAFKGFPVPIVLLWSEGHAYRYYGIEKTWNTVIVRPDGSNAAPTRLFNIYKPVYHTVLVFTDDKDYALPVVFAFKGFPVPIVLLWSEGHAYRYYGIEKTWNTVIVRPDGVVGHRRESRGLAGRKRRHFPMRGFRPGVGLQVPLEEGVQFSTLLENFSCPYFMIL